MIIRQLFVPLMVALALVATSCGGDEENATNNNNNNNNNNNQTEEPEPEPEPEPKPEPEPAFEVGDLYSNTSGEVTGVIYYVDETGEHGLVVSLVEQENVAWSSESRLTGANNEFDGEFNMNTIRQREDWQTLYASFKWCADLGEGWYIPASEELYTLYEACLADINTAIVEAKGVALSGAYYLSSTEYDAQRISCVDFGTGYGSRVMKDNATNNLRAVRKF